MKLLVEPCSKKINYSKSIDGVILAIEDYAVEATCYFNLDEIIKIKNDNSFEVFVKLNKNLFNEDLEKVRDILIKLDNSGVDGVFFYDLAILELKRELKLDIDLIWHQTHMVNNYKTCDYYYSKGVKYALLGKEITLDEIIEIINKSKITSMVEVVSLPSVGFSRRKLVSNYCKDINDNKTNELNVREKITDTFYNVIEDDNGTCFYLKRIMNGTSVISKLMECGCQYIIFREYGIPEFDELVSDTYEYINNGCVNKNYVNKYKKLGDSTNFFFKKTIYRVK